MKLILACLLSLISSAALAADFKCYSSRYPENMQHAFVDGYSVLSVTGTTVTLQYFHTNNLTQKTTLEYSAVYTVQGLHGGSGKLSQFYVAEIKKIKPGQDGIETLYLEPTLLNPSSASHGLVGKYAFSGHQYLYDWNLCYAK